MSGERLDRRRLLTRGGVGLAALAGGARASAGTAATDAGRPVPFHGLHQAGVTTPAPPAACFVACDVVASRRSELADLLRTLTARARFLTAGGTPPSVDVRFPPGDSGTLGPIVPGDGLTITVGVGSTLFDARYGIADRAPARLTPMRAFPNDDLQPALCGGDLLVQLCAESRDTVLHAVRDLAKHTRGSLQVRWQLDAFRPAARPDGAPRNLFAFKDPIANPHVDDPAVANAMLWTGPAHGEPAWTEGGTYQVCRIIRMFLEFWDRVSLNEQQTMIGRYRDTGAPLGSSDPLATPDYARDPHGSKIPLTSHIRLANPRTPAAERTRIYRRSFSYQRGIDEAGNQDAGLVFCAFQQDPVRQFDAIQRRLRDEPMVDYVRPIGGGLFFVLPGVQGSRDWYGRALLA